MKLCYIGTLLSCLLTTSISCAKLSPGDGRDQKHKSQSAELDLLTDYDRNIWGGPDAWSEEQWRWKRQLNWHHDCDYLGDVLTHDIAHGQKLVQIICTPGAYQPMQYLYLFDPKTQAHQQLALGDPGNTDNIKEINGRIEFHQDTNVLTILTLSRGTADCGVWRKFDFSQRQPKLIAKHAKACSSTPLPANPPADLFNPEKWPEIKVE